MMQRSIGMVVLGLGLGCAMSSPSQDVTRDAGSTPGVDAGQASGVDAGVVSTVTTIAELRSGTVSVDTQVQIEAAVVTGIVVGRGLWIQQGSGPDSGIFVFGSQATETEGLVVGKSIDLSATFTIYNDLKQLQYPTITAMNDGQLPEPFVVSAQDLATSPSFEGVLVRASDLSIVNANPDDEGGQPCARGAEDCTDYGQIEVNDGLYIDDELFPELRSGRYFLRQVGTEFTSVTGIAHLSFAKRKLLPRGADDLVVVGGAPDFSTTIQAIQSGEVAEDSPVEIREAIVTATTHPSEERYRGMWIQQGRGSHSGIYVFFGSSPLPAVEPGSTVNVSGTYSEFRGQSQLVYAQVEVTGQSTLPEPSTVMAAELAGASDGDNHASAEQWEGVLVRVENVSITQANADSNNGELCADGDDDCRDYGTFAVDDGLRITDRLWPSMSDGSAFERRVGTRFGAIVGIAEEAFGHHSLAPRKPADVISP